MLLSGLVALAAPVSAESVPASQAAEPDPQTVPDPAEPDNQRADLARITVHWATVRTSIGDNGGSLDDPRSCAIRLDKTLWCWGDEDANLADGDKLRLELVPRQVGTGTDWQSVELGSRHGCAIDGTGDLYCWGSNNFGQLGDGTEVARDVLGQVTGPTGWTAIAAAFGQTCGITEDAALWCWGANSPPASSATAR